MHHLEFQILISEESALIWSSHWDSLWPFVDLERSEIGMNLGKHGHFLEDAVFEMDQDKVL